LEGLVKLSASIEGGEREEGGEKRKKNGRKTVSSIFV